MMWKVQVGFDTENETVNFGSRRMAVVEKSVYETSTLAIITKDEKVGISFTFYYAGHITSINSIIFNFRIKSTIK